MFRALVDPHLGDVQPTSPNSEINVTLVNNKQPAMNMSNPLYPIYLADTIVPWKNARLVLIV